MFDYIVNNRSRINCYFPATVSPASGAAAPTAAAAAAAARPTARGPPGTGRHATIVKPEDDGFEVFIYLIKICN